MEGSLTLAGANGTTSGHGGSVTISAGNSGANSPGIVSIDSGTGSLNGGAISIGTANAGSVTIGNTSQNSNAGSSIYSFRK